MRGVITRALLIILGIAFLCFILRGFILDLALKKVVSKIETRYGYTMIVGDKELKGLAGVHLQSLVVVPMEGDTLLKIDSVYMRPSLLNLLIGRLRLTELSVINMQLHLACKDSVCNYLPKRIQTGNNRPHGAETGYSGVVARVLSGVFNTIPKQINLENINIKIDKDSLSDNISVPHYEFSGGWLRGIISDNTSGASWNMSGMLSRDDKTFDIKILPVQPDSRGLPLIKNFFEAYCNFDSLEIILSENTPGNSLKCKGLIQAFDLRLLHPKLSDDTIVMKDFTGSFTASVGNDFLELDSLSYIKVNKLPMNVYMRYDKDPVKTYSLVIKTGEQDADNFFASLPKGMFTDLQGIEAAGTLDFSLLFHLDSSQPDSLNFDVQFKKKKFSLKKYGSSDLMKMREEFLYTAYEKGRPVTSFVVGWSNPDFSSLEKISPYLRNAILTSEDGGFFYHRGFNEDAFRKSIAANYKAGKFVRGGSTITMQLVKNVFLTRHKTIARKAEEAFIVWLIENNNLYSKERMFEVYLNILEMGPGVYGVKNASMFYFGKQPDELTLSESIFMASLLPRPKWFKYSFDETGNLKPYFADYYRVVSNFMLKKGLITEEEFMGIQPRVELKGPAKAMVIPSDTIPAGYMDVYHD